MSAWLNDLRLAVRTLRAARGFTFAAVLLLALGIAAATTLFSIANALLFRPFPFADQERLGIAGEDQLGPQSEVSYRDVEDWRGGSHVCRRDVDRGGCAGPQNHAQANPLLGTTRRVPDPRLPKLDRHPRYARRLVERFLSGELIPLVTRRRRIG